MAWADSLVIIVFILAVTMTIWVLIQRSSNDGKLIIERDKESGKIIFTLEVDIDPYEIENMKHVTFKVVERPEIAD